MTGEIKGQFEGAAFALTISRQQRPLPDSNFNRNLLAGVHGHGQISEARSATAMLCQPDFGLYNPH